MLTPNYLMNVAEPMVDLWSQVEFDILADIARRIVKCGGRISDTAAWQILKAREMGVLQTDIAKILAQATKTSEKEMAKLVVDACKDALAFDDAIYIKAGYAPIPLAQSDALMAVVHAGIRKTGGLMSNFTGTTAQTATRAFEICLDRAYMQVNTGAFTLDQALSNVIRDLAEQGTNRIVYPTMKSDHMDVAARRALLTGLNQTTAELQLARMDELNTHLVEVTSHAGARPSHAVWQGRIYWYGERVKGYENLEEATGYGTGAGLCGWNCYHSFYPYFDGISRQAFERDPASRLAKSNDQVYEESQRQRYYERQIRDARRQCAVYASAMEAQTRPEEKAALANQFEAAAVKLKRREAALNAFIDETGRTKRPARMRVYGYDRSVSAKATHAAKRAANE